MGKIHAMTGVVYVHLKTGGAYEVLGVGTVEADMTQAVIYRSKKDGRTWIRPSSEFCDGRFIYADDPRAKSALPDSSGKLREALEFYADPKTHQGQTFGHEWVAPIELDAGKRARAALSSTGGDDA